jgi:hypothetical protein
VLHEFDDVRIARYVAPHGGEGLGEGAHHEVDLVFEAEVLAGTAAVRAEHPDAVGVVDHEAHAEALLERDDLVELRDVSLHGEDAVDHDEDATARIPGRDLELLLEVCHVVVLVLVVLAEAETTAVDDAGVVEVVEDGDVAASQQRGEHAEIHLEAGGEGERGVALHELGDLLLELDVDVEGAIEQPRPGGARAVHGDRHGGGLLHVGVARQSQVVVRAEHDELVALVGHHGVLGR